MKQVLIIFFTLITYISFSQEVIVEKAKHRVYENGKLYYIHKVKKGETLYAISKAYNLNQKDIVIENPEIFNGLSVGQKIKIPVINDGFGNIDTSKYYIHKVNKGETLYSISRKYNVKVSSIINENPEAKNKLRSGDIIKVPKQNIIKENITKNKVSNEESFKYHTVLKHETLYMLSKKYNISIDSIKIFNPEIKTKGLLEGMVLRLPKFSKKISLNYQLKDSIKLDSTLFYKKDTNICDINVPINSYRVVNVAVLLPFTLDSQTKSREAKEQKKENYLPRPKPFVEFYQGILASLDTLNKMGISVNLYTYDTKNDTNVVKSILSELKNKQINFIIGPAFNSNINIIKPYSQKNNIPIISPFSTLVDKKIVCKYLIQINPEFETQLNIFIDNIPDTANYKYIVIYNDAVKEKPIINKYKKRLYANYSDSLGNLVLFTELDFEKNKKSLEKFLSVGKNNLIIIPSDNTAFVYDVITRLNIIYKDYKNLYLFGFPYWQNYSDLDYEYLHRLNYQTLNVQHIDYDSSDVKLFIRDFNSTFKQEPSKYSFLGYDIFKYFSISYNKFGDDFLNCITKYNYKGYSIYFNIVKQNNMYKNNAMFIEQYKSNYNVTARFVK